jgi:SAM-dependent methyltransferase
MNSAESGDASDGPHRSLSDTRTLDMQSCFAGEKLYGDDFGPEEREDWFRDEQSAYFQLGKHDSVSYGYSYHAIDQYHGFQHLSSRTFGSVLGIGSAYGHEFRPVLHKLTGSITILEPASGFHNEALDGIPLRYLTPRADGVLPFGDSEFDLITCLSVLHHIPNVSKVVSEIYRCTRRDGCVILREPVVSMGDWRYPRPGLTKRERGIPLSLFRDMVLRAGFRIVREARCFFPITSRLRYLKRSPVFNSRPCVIFDALLCSLPWSKRYHASRFWHKFRPLGVYLLLTK